MTSIASNTIVPMNPDDPTNAETVQAIEQVFSSVLTAINDGTIVPDDAWLSSFSDVLGAWVDSRDSLAMFPANLPDWAEVASSVYDDAMAMAQAAPVPPPVSAATGTPRLWQPKRITPPKRAAVAPVVPPPAPPAPSSVYGRGTPTVTRPAAPAGRRTGAVVLERPRHAPGSVSVPSWLSWVPRIKL